MFDFFIGVEMVMCHALICIKGIYQSLTVCNGSIELTDDQFSPLNSSSCCSSNTDDSLNCTVKNERNLNVLSLNCCGVKLRLQYPEFCELIKKK